MTRGAPQLYEDAPGNLCGDWAVGDAAATAQLVMRWEGIPAGLLTTVAACGLLSGSGLSICIEKHHG